MMDRGTDANRTEFCISPDQYISLCVFFRLAVIDSLIAEHFRLNRFKVVVSSVIRQYQKHLRRDEGSIKNDVEYIYFPRNINNVFIMFSSAVTG